MVKRCFHSRKLGIKRCYLAGRRKVLLISGGNKAERYVLKTGNNGCNSEVFYVLNFFLVVLSGFKFVVVDMMSNVSYVATLCV